MIHDHETQAALWQAKEKLPLVTRPAYSGCANSCARTERRRAITEHGNNFEVTTRGQNCGACPNADISDLYVSVNSGETEHVQGALEPRARAYPPACGECLFALAESRHDRAT